MKSVEKLREIKVFSKTLSGQPATVTFGSRVRGNRLEILNVVHCVKKTIMNSNRLKANQSSLRPARRIKSHFRVRVVFSSPPQYGASAACSAIVGSTLC